MEKLDKSPTDGKLSYDELLKVPSVNEPNSDVLCLSFHVSRLYLLLRL